MNTIVNKVFNFNLPDQQFNAVCDAVSRLEQINIICEHCKYASERRNSPGMRHCGKPPRKHCPKPPR